MTTVPWPTSPRPHGVVPPGRPRRRLFAVVALTLALIGGAAVPAGALLTGVDVASWQHPNGAAIDWRQVRAAGHSFAFVKASEGTTYRNPYFVGDFAGAGNAGLFRGAYHYARPAYPLSTAVAQARYFVSTTGSLGGALDLPGVLDLEESGGLSKADLAQWARIWLGEVERLTGRPPIVYTGYYFWRDQVGNPTDIGLRNRLWLASYPADPNSTTFRPLVPAGWATWTFWQYTSTGRVPGIVGDVDLNRFCCDPAGLAGLAGTGAGAGLPFGTLEAGTRLPSGAAVSGWVIDPDTTGAVDVHFYADGRYAGQLKADRTRTDVGAAYPGFTSNHGFSGTVPVPSGARQICGYAINVGAGAYNPSIGCARLDGNPIGNFESASGAEGGVVTASGWALDPDTTGPIDVHVYVSGRWGQSVVTTQVREDVRAAYPGAGPTQGWTATFTGLPAGTHSVCAHAINVAAGDRNPLLGCRTVSVPVVDPIGGVDGASTGLGTARLRGWALDFGTSGPIDVHIYANGAFLRAVTSDRQRSDIGAFFGVDPRKGFDETFDLPSGRHQLCAYGINVGAGSTNPLLGCRTVDIGANPVGNLEAVTRSGNQVTVSGWVIDPDSTGPVDIHVYVDGGWGGLVQAAAPRPDVGAAFPSYGPDHGFALTIPVSAAPRQVCAYAINVGPGTTNPLLGCRVV
jgi:GH25 family lysozyme M1 (1,4-beta-N-acetylmuramidase)